MLSFYQKFKPLDLKEKIKSIKKFDGKFNNSELEFVLNVLENSKAKDIDYVKKLESLFCKKFKVKYAIACNSGTSGLHAALFSLDIKKNDEVIVPGLAVVMDAYAAIHLGAKPIFCDVDPDTFLINAKEIEKKITKKTKAIITVSLQGLPMDIDPIMKLAKKHNIKVIEDNAQDLLGKYKKRLSGFTGDIGVWSFENKKHLSGASEGGIISTNNKSLAEKIRKFAGIGYKNMTAEGGRTSLAIETVQNPDYKRFDTIGLNYRMPQIVAAVAYAQLKSSKNIVNKRVTSAKYFREAIKGCDWLIEQKIPKNYSHSHYTFAVKYLKDKLKKKYSWKDIYKMYKSLGGDGFYGACVPIHLEPSIKKYFVKNCKKCFKKCLKKKGCQSEGSLPVAEKIQKQIMQFKTNYRDPLIAKKKSLILKKLIKKIELSR
ncbi:DegT/DnrJ/EryC1/StrS aminotransferase family protein [Candidatus Pelagibacter sp.]|jgi:perosamine synthetase|nr:DegT/DnrJ/EryC1/StrS aminotransferase family protein [Candidatus Pelagibacter sp.]